MINVTKTYLPDVDKYKKYIDEIFESGWLTNNGQFVKELERRLEEYLGVKHLILVSNGTLALQIAYKALDLHGEVITTPFSFVATTSTIAWEGLKPVFVDINEETFNMDCTQIERAITENTSAIVPVHVFGNPCDVDSIFGIAQKHNLKVVYDAAHAFGVKYKDKNILNFGDVSIVSFHSTKIFHTIEGGAIIVDDDELYEKIKLMINFGISGPDKVECLGINAKMNEFQAAMGLCILSDMDKILEGRKKVFDYYMINLPKRLQLQKYTENCTNNYAYFPVVFESEEVLLKVKCLLNNNDIFPRRYFYPSLEMLTYLNSVESVPVSNSISKRILCLPIYESLDVLNIDSIIKMINEVII